VTERFPCIDGLRAIAAFAVLVTHVSFVTTANRVVGGSYFARLDSGVAIFFVISGFLLYRPFVAAALRGDTIGGIRAYFWRRGLRIFPAYWAAALTMVLVFSAKPWAGVGDALMHLGLVHIYDPDTVVSGPISQAWSLGTEISFYVVLPLLAVVASAIGRRTDRRIGPQLAFVGVLIVASLIYRWQVYEHAGANAATMATWLPGYLDQFGLGMLLAVVSAASAQQAAEGGSVWPAWTAFTANAWFPFVSWMLAFASLSAAAFVIDLPTSSLDYSVGEVVGRQVTYGLWGLFLVLPAAFGPQRDRGGAVRWFLRTRVARSLGLVSYGVYLWHQFFIDRFQRVTGTPEFSGRFGETLLFVVVGATAAATISYVVVEKPVLRLKDLGPGRTASPIPVGPSGTGSAVPASRT